MVERGTIIFDFDGTIADSFKENFGIYNEIAVDFKCKKLTSRQLEEIRNKRPQEMLEQYGVTKMKMPLLLVKGRKRMSKIIHKIKPIKGITKELIALKDEGFKLGILTSNSKKNIKIFLKNNNLEEFFSFIHSSRNFFGKSNSINRVLKKRKISRNSVIYIGDETRDIEASKKAKISVVAVSWGYNTPKILNSLHPEKLIQTPKELVPYLKGFFKVK